MKRAGIIVASGLLICAKSASADKNFGLGLGYDRVTSDKAYIVDTLKPNIHVRAPKYTLLELGAEVGKSIVLDLKLHFLRTGRVQIHLIDPGIYWPLHDLFFLRQDVERSFDFVFGGGVDVFVWRNLMVSVGARWMLPNPFEVMPDVKDGKYDKQESVSPGDSTGSGPPLSPPTLLRAPVQDPAAQALDRANFLKDVYLDSLRAVHLTFDLRWYW